ncbi:putative ribonuclease H-like domain-containing protein [Tanacetum coccineum]
MLDYPDREDSNIDVVEDIPVDVPNILPTHPALQLDFDFIPSNDLGSDLDVSSPSGDRNKIFDPGICIEVESTRFLATLSPVIDTLIPFSSENDDKVFNHGVLASKEKSPSSLSHRGFKASKLFHQKSPMLIHGDNTPNLEARLFYSRLLVFLWFIVQDFPDCDDSRARGTGYAIMDKIKTKADKTKHEIEKSARIQVQRQDLGFIPSGNVVLSSTYVGKILGADQLLVILCYRYQESGIGYWILSMTISGSGVSMMGIRLNEVARRDRSFPQMEKLSSLLARLDIESSSFAKIEFVKPKQQEKTARKTINHVEENRQNIHTPRGNQRNWNNMMSQRLGSNFEMFNKACYVCESFDQLQNIVPRAVLMKSGLVSVNTARQVNTAHPKITVNSARPMTNLSKSTDSTVKWPIYKNTTFKNSNFNQRVNTVKDKNVNIVRPKAVVNAAKPKAVVNVVKGNNVNAVKASTCWVWKPKTKVLGHVFKHNSASIPKKGNPQMDLQDQGVIDSGCSRHMTGNMSYLTDYEEIDGGYVAFGGNPKGGKITGRDETSDILKSFITRVENLIDQRVKVIRCDNGTKFKNKEMNQFYERKGIKREFSVARTPQQNRVAKRKNRTLIEAGRTMLGKFDGKVDEGFFVGYSIKSKAFRVFNSRTRIVEENMHVQFSENTPNIAGSGPIWLFDIDAIINTYKDYILLPLWITDPSFSQNSKSSPDDGFKPSGDDKKVTEELGKEGGYPSKDCEGIDQEKEDNVNITNNVNVASINEVNAVGGKTSIDLPLDLNMPLLEDIVYSDDDEYVGVEADMNNLDAFMHVSPIPTTRVLKDHPFSKEQTIKTFKTACLLAFYHRKNPKRLCGVPMDVKSDFLYVEKALYGLHQAPRAWYETLSTYLLDNEFQKGTLDKTLFIRRDKGDILLVQVYVDDIIFCSTKKSLCIEFEKMMHKKFQMSSMGELTFFLGLQVKQKEDGIFISQDKYVTEILKKFSFTDVKTASTPMETQKPLLKDEDGEEVDVHLYRSMIGSLMYLTSSRPDIMFAVCACARYQVNPKVSHLYAVKRIFRYLKGQPKLGLWYPKDSPFDLVAYTDSDYAGASLDRKSTTGGCQFLGCRLISWQCKKQTVVANSTTEAEYVAASSCCGQVLWIQNQLLDYGDSNEKKLIQMIKIYTDKNVADLLTKAFDDEWNGMLRMKLELVLASLTTAGLLLLKKVNAVRHNLLLPVQVNDVEVADQKFADSHNMVVALEKPAESDGFEQIVDFLNAHTIKYALTINPTIYTSCIEQFWATAKVKTVNGEK